MSVISRKFGRDNTQGRRVRVQPPSGLGGPHPSRGVLGYTRTCLLAVGSSLVHQVTRTVVIAGVEATDHHSMHTVHAQGPRTYLQGPLTRISPKTTAHSQPVRTPHFRPGSGAGSVPILFPKMLIIVLLSASTIIGTFVNMMYDDGCNWLISWRSDPSGIYMSIPTAAPVHLAGDDTSQPDTASPTQLHAPELTKLRLCEGFYPVGFRPPAAFSSGDATAGVQDPAAARTYMIKANSICIPKSIMHTSPPLPHEVPNS